MKAKRDRIEVVTESEVTATTGEPSFWWRVIGPNGKTLCHSENYSSRRAALKSARAFGGRNGIEVAEAKE